MKAASPWHSIQIWIKRGFLALMLLLLMLTGLGAALLGTAPGLSMTQSLINRFASSDQQIIQMDGLDQLWGGVQIRSLTMADKEGVWLEAKDFDLSYSLSDLLSLRLRSEHLTLSQLIIHRSPHSAEQEPPPAPDAPLVPALPALRADFNKITIDHIQLGEALLGKRAQLTLAGTLVLDDKPMHMHGTLSLQHQDVANGFVRAQWDFLPTEGKRHIAIEMHEPRGGLVARLLDMANLPSLSLSIKGDGPAHDWRSTLSVAMDGVNRVSGSLTAQLSRQSKRIQASLKGNLAPFVPSSLVPLVAGTSQLTAFVEEKEGILTVSEAIFQSALAGLMASGQVDLAKETLDLSGRFDLSREGVAVAFQQDGRDDLLVEPASVALRLKGPMASAQLRGQLTAKRLSQGDVSLADLSLDVIGSDVDLVAGQGALETTLTIAMLELGSRSFNAALGGPVTLTADVDVSPDLLSIQRSKLTGQHLHAQLDGTLGADALALTGHAHFTALEQIDAQLDGAIKANFTTSGTLAVPALSLSLLGEKVTIAKKQVEDLALSLKADATPNASFALTATYDGAPLSVTSNLTSDQAGTITLQDLSIEAPGADVTGAVTLATNGLAQGDVTINLEDLGKLGPLFLQPDLRGSLNGTLALSEQGGKQAIILKAKVPALHHSAMRVANLTLDGKLLDPMGTPTVDMGMKIDRLTTAGETLHTLDARMKGTAGQLPFSLRGQLSGQPLRLEGALTRSSAQMQLAVNAFQAGWKGVDIQLVKPTYLDLKKGVRFNKPLVLSVDDGRVTLSGHTGEAFDLALTLEALPLAVADKIAPTGEAISGLLSLKAKATGALANPLVKWTGAISKLSTRTMRNVDTPPLTVQTEGRFQGSSLLLNNRITGGGADLGVAGLVAVDSQRLDLDVKGNVPFSLAAKALADAGLRLDGAALIDTKITGSTANPSLSGAVGLDGARLVELSSGLVVRDMSGRIALGGQQARLDDITGHLGKEGKLTLSGLVDLDPQKSLPTDMRLIIRDGAFKHEDLLASQFNADLALKGDLAGSSNLTGRIALTNTEISIPETLPGGLSPVAVAHRNASDKVEKQAKGLKPQAPANGSPSSTIELDLEISSPRRIYVRGRGLDAELGGTIRIMGDANNPKPVGRISMQRGRMDLLSRRLDFDTGIVTFAGSLDPALDFSATTNNANGRFTVSVGGYASAPEIGLSSSPSLPQDEVLAQIFFNESLSDLSPLQLAQLANAVATLSGVNSGPGLVDRLRNLAGIDNIDVTSDAETGETTVGVGRYLNDRTYINVEKGASSKAGKVMIDLDITNQLKARGEADVTGKSKAGIFFERDY